MPLQFFALHEALAQLIQHVALAGRQRGGTCGVHRGKIAVFHVVFHAVDHDGLRHVIHLFQQGAALHAEIRVAADQRTFQLEQHYGDGLVHPCGACKVSRGILALLYQLGPKAGNVRVPVHLLGILGKRPQADAVAVLQRLQIVVAERHMDDAGNAHRAAGRRAHPLHVVVTPLYIHGMVAHQLIQNDVRPGAAVEDITHDVQAVHSQPLDELRQSGDKVIRTANVNDGIQNTPVVKFLIVVLKVGVQQLVQDICKIPGQALAHKTAGVFGGHHAAHVDQPVQRLSVPCAQVALPRLQLGQLLCGIIDQRCKLRALGVGHLAGQHTVHLFLDHAGGISKYMRKGVGFTVQVAHKVLRGLRQPQDGLKVDDLTGGRSHGGILLCKLHQKLFFCRMKHFLHEQPPFRDFFLRNIVPQMQKIWYTIP